MNASNFEFYQGLLCRGVGTEAWQYDHRLGDLTQAWVGLITSLAQTYGGCFPHGEPDVFRGLKLTALVKVFGAGKTTLGQGLCKALGVPEVRAGLREWCDTREGDFSLAQKAILDRILVDLVPGDAVPKPGRERSFGGMQHLYVDYRCTADLTGMENLATTAIHAQVKKAISERQGLLVHLDEVGMLSSEEVARLRRACATAIIEAQKADSLVFFLWTGKFLEMPADSAPGASLSKQFRFIDVKALTVEQIGTLTHRLLVEQPPENSVSGRFAHCLRILCRVVSFICCFVLCVLRWSMHPGLCPRISRKWCTGPLLGLPASSFTASECCGTELVMGSLIAKRGIS